MQSPPDPLTLIAVSWHDCYSEDAWTSIGDLLLRTTYTIDTVGWYIGQTEGHWVIASGLDTKGNAGSTWFIPEVLIKTWRALT